MPGPGWLPQIGDRQDKNCRDQAPIGFDFPVDIDLIDWVEVIRGFSSSLYGTYASFAVVNVIRHNGHDLSDKSKGLKVAVAGLRRPDFSPDKPVPRRPDPDSSATRSFCG